MNKLILKPVYSALCWVPVLLYSCHADDPEVSVDSYAFEKPANFPEPTYTFENNPLTKEGFALGKKLFFDPMLSRDNSVSCNNCHQQSRAFADTPLHPVSIGVANRMGKRNAPALANLAFYPEFFWDGGVTHLDFVPINAIEADFEMDEQLANVVAKLNAHAAYPAQFRQAFGIEEITAPYILYALSQFTNRMVSANSRYDKYVRGEGESLSSLELQGLAAFEQKCATCHSGALFTDFSYRNNGLNSTFTDRGRGGITEATEDDGKFRVPSLRNAELTPPYMHNARFSTLEEVLEHYARGMVASPSLDPVFKAGDQVVGIPLTEEEKTSIIAFIKTLTDREFTSNPIFRNND